jgi:hypothetical protein
VENFGWNFSVGKVAFGKIKVGKIKVRKIDHSEPLE